MEKDTKAVELQLGGSEVFYGSRFRADGETRVDEDMEALSSDLIRLETDETPKLIVWMKPSQAIDAIRELMQEFR